MEWQGLESAPRDGKTEALYWCECGDGSGWIKVGILMPNEPQHLSVYDDSDDYFPHENGGYLTHWMPMPEPPTT